jgi:beta-glucosidase
MTGSTPLTLEQQAALGSGANFWASKAVGDVPAIVMADGPHGVRKQAGDPDHLGVGASVPATCFPPAVGLAQTWDPALAERVGAALGEESQAAGVHVLLGPGVNIKRDPRCGRNFEYFSEDPLLAGVLGAAWVRGLQSRGVGASLKHYAANNAEDDRMRVSSDVDPRTLREVYLRPFQRVVQQAQPWTVMCAYNRLNGLHASEHPWLLTEVLREQWGFEGVVVSDWGAVRDRPAATAAGLDVEMPTTSGVSDAQVVDAVRAGTLDPAAVELAARRVAALAARATAAARPGTTVDVDAHHALAREVASRAVVLLKNDGGLLPLSPQASLAVIGPFAARPRFQGGGSSHVNPTRVDVPLEEIRRLVEGPVTYAEGLGDHDEAVRVAGEAETAVVFLGLSDADESEGYDRTHIELPAEQLQLLRAVVAVQPRTVVVLSHGGVVRLADVAALAPAVLDGALLGQAGGGALADVLLGVVNPSGRLAETVPVRLEDTPSFLTFPGEHGHIVYGERVFVGHRWYDARDLPVSFPFGHGLSYTTFEHGDLAVEETSGGLRVGVTVRNTGGREGREVVQVYAGLPGSQVARAPRVLVGSAVVGLAAGAAERVVVEVSRDDLAYWDVRLDRWVVEPGTYEVSVGASSRDLRQSTTVALAGDDVRPPLGLSSTVGEVLADPVVGPRFRAAVQGTGGLFDADAAEGDALGVDLARMMAWVPVDRLVAFTGGVLTRERLEELLAAG